MAKAGSKDVVFKIDSTDGGSLTGITQYVTRIGEIVVNREAVDATPFGANDEQYIIGVIKRRDPLVIGGFWDDTASTGPDAILNINKVTHEATRSVEITLKTGKTISGEVWIERYTRTLEVGAYHGYEASLRFTGTVSET